MMKGFRARRAPGGKRRSRLLCDHAGLFFGRVGAARGLCFGVFTARQKVRSGNFGFSLCRDFVRCAFLSSTAALTSLGTRHGYSVAILVSSGLGLCGIMIPHPAARLFRHPGSRLGRRLSFAPIPLFRKGGAPRAHWSHSFQQREPPGILAVAEGRKYCPGARRWAKWRNPWRTALPVFFG
jgi:hypothetical protein